MRSECLLQVPTREELVQCFLLLNDSLPVDFIIQLNLIIRSESAMPDRHLSMVKPFLVELLMQVPGSKSIFDLRLHDSMT